MCLAALSYSTFALDCIIYYFVLFFAHGVVSPLMFRMIDWKTKELGTRNIELIKGRGGTYSIFIIWFFIILWNIRRPPSLNLVVEIFLLKMVCSIHFLAIGIVLLGLFISSCYNLRILLLVSGQKTTRISYILFSALFYTYNWWIIRFIFYFFGFCWYFLARN